MPQINPLQRPKQPEPQPQRRPAQRSPGQPLQLN
jgi:hypothetical protein